MSNMKWNNYEFVLWISRQSATEAKKQNHQLMEKVQQIQNEASEAELRGSEMDQQLKTSHEVWLSLRCLHDERKTPDLIVPFIGIKMGLSLEGSKTEEVIVSFEMQSKKCQVINIHMWKVY